MDLYDVCEKLQVGSLGNVAGGDNNVAVRLITQRSIRYGDTLLVVATVQCHGEVGLIKLIAYENSFADVKILGTASAGSIIEISNYTKKSSNEFQLGKGSTLTVVPDSKRGMFSFPSVRVDDLALALSSPGISLVTGLLMEDFRPAKPYVGCSSCHLPKPRDVQICTFCCSKEASIHVSGFCRLSDSLGNQVRGFLDPVSVCSIFNLPLGKCFDKQVQMGGGSFLNSAVKLSNRYCAIVSDQYSKRHSDPITHTIQGLVDPSVVKGEGDELEESRVGMEQIAASVDDRVAPQGSLSASSRRSKRSRRA
jgi:hypothetical protein